MKSKKNTWNSQSGNIINLRVSSKRSVIRVKNNFENPTSKQIVLILEHVQIYFSENFVEKYCNLSLDTSQLLNKISNIVMSDEIHLEISVLLRLAQDGWLSHRLTAQIHILRRRRHIRCACLVVPGEWKAGLLFRQNMLLLRSAGEVCLKFEGGLIINGNFGDIFMCENCFPLV